MRKNLLFILVVFYSLNVYSQRNVVLIIADDLSPDYFGFYADHGDTIDAPHIRSLFENGVLFENAMSNPVCSSTRAGILTGRYSFRTGVGGIVGGIGGSNPLDTAEITIPRLLKSFNPDIKTAQIGKWHLHQASPASHLLYPNVMGFDHFEGPFIGQLPSYSNWTKYINGVPATVTNYATSEGVDNAVTWIGSHTMDPFFLWLAFNAPHEPLHLPPAGLYSDTTLTGTNNNIMMNPKKYFKADLEALDHEIGRLMDSLQSLNLLDSTDIIFMGDNGNTPRTAQIADTSRAKGTIYQGGVHVPFIVSGPSVVNPGRVSDALVNTADVFVSVAEMMGDLSWLSQIPVNKPVDSQSILPILKNQSTQIRQWSFCEIFKLTTDADDGKAMRNWDYKLLNFDDGHQEFYNLSVDSLESTNLLNGTLSSTELLNYYFLCNEMTGLIGTGNFCSSMVGISNPKSNGLAVTIYPNPFTSHISLSLHYENEFFELRNYCGQLVYSGSKIESEDFSNLPNGMYFLQDLSRSNAPFKLIKKDKL